MSDPVQPGALFRGRDGQERRVWDVRNGRVHYFAREPGGRFSPGHGPDDAPTLEAFATEVDGLDAPDPGAAAEPEGPRPIPDHRNPFR